VNDDAPQEKWTRWIPLAISLVLLIAIVLLGLLAMSVIERRWEAARPMLVAAVNLGEWESDSGVWGQNFPREYETYLKTSVKDTRTLFGGAVQRDYLAEMPHMKVLFAGYGFSKEYRQARGHIHAIDDVVNTKRIKTPFNAATCWTCKSPDVPRLMDKMGPVKFYASNFHDLEDEVTHPIGCADCHDPKTMHLTITRPALKEGLLAMGRDIEKDKPSLQEMRSLVCAQCHVEYYFKAEPKNYLTFPWEKGTSVEAMIAYYDERDFVDYEHAISKTPIIKAQHPDYELWTTGVHAYRGVSCADCHMPYRTEGAVKFTDHHVRSPLLNISASCAVCHRWGEDDIRKRVESIQTTVRDARVAAGEALVRAHRDVAAAMAAGAGDEALAPARKLIRHGQFRWDYIAASNGMGFHSPQESMRVLGDARAKALEARLNVSRLHRPAPAPAPPE